MSKKILVALIVSSTVLSACQAVPTAPSVPARLVQVDDIGLQELQRATEQLLGMPTVPLDKSTLSDSSQFVIARAPRRDANGLLIQGRVVEPGHVFQLFLRDKSCWLFYQNSKQEVLLKHARCAAE